MLADIHARRTALPWDPVNSTMQSKGNCLALAGSHLQPQASTCIKQSTRQTMSCAMSQAENHEAALPDMMLCPAINLAGIATDGAYPVPAHIALSLRCAMALRSTTRVASL